jgi:hypothetical protein
MSTPVLRGADKKKEAEKMLEQKPILVLFFMDGCPHCAANKPAWDGLKGTVDMPMVEIEASATPESTGVYGFPTMMLIDEKGTKTKTEGQKSSADEIKKELKLSKKKKGSSRRRHALRKTNRRSRKLRHRTLRNYVALI